MSRKPLLWFFAFIVVIAFVLFSSPLWMKHLLPWSANHYIKDVRVESLNYQRASFRWPSTLEFSSLAFTLKKDGILYQINAPSLNLSWRFPGRLNVSFEGASIKSLLFEANGFSFEGSTASKNKETQLEGRLKGDSFSANHYEIKDVRSFLRGDFRHLVFSDLTAQGYGGMLSGEIFLEYVPKISYSINIQIKDMESVLLREANQSVFSQMTGKIIAVVHLTGRPEGIGHLEGSFDMAAGGSLKASILNFLIPHLPQIQQKKQLEALVRENGDISFEKGTLKFRNIDGETLSNQINLESELFNLNFNVGLDIHVDGGLNQLFNLMKP